MTLMGVRGRGRRPRIKRRSDPPRSSCVVRKKSFCLVAPSAFCLLPLSLSLGGHHFPTFVTFPTKLLLLLLLVPPLNALRPFALVTNDFRAELFSSNRIVGKLVRVVSTALFGVCNLHGLIGHCIASDRYANFSEAIQQPFSSLYLAHTRGTKPKNRTITISLALRSVTRFREAGKKVAVGGDCAI